MAGATATYSGRSIEWARVKGLGAEPKNIFWGTGVASANLTGNASNSDVNFWVPRTQEARVAATSTLITTTFLADTYQLVGTITCLTAPGNITEFGAFDTAAALSPTTTLSGNITNATTGNVTVGNIATFPNTGNFYFQIDNEVLVGNFSGNTSLNIISRGALGSAAGNHSNGTSVTLGGDGGAGANGATSAQTATVGTAQGGNMFVHANFNQIGLNVGDSIIFTMTDQFT